MALLVCKSCKKAFIGGPQDENFCPDCDIRLRKLYPSVRSFLRNHYYEVYTAHSLSKVMDIAPDDVDSMVLMGLLEYRGKEADSGKNTLYAHSNKKNKTNQRGSM